MSYMFEYASTFNQRIGDWNVSNLTNAQDMFAYVKLSTANYDALLNGWDAQNLQHGVLFSGGKSTYCTSSAARAHMISWYGWEVTDGGKNCIPDIYLPVITKG